MRNMVVGRLSHFLLRFFPSLRDRSSSFSSFLIRRQLLIFSGLDWRKEWKYDDDLENELEKDRKRHVERAAFAVVEQAIQTEIDLSSLNLEKWREYLLRTMELGPSSVNNVADLFYDGDEIFDAQWLALANATESVGLEIYTIEPDFIGNRMLDGLFWAAHRGINIRFVFDDFGSQKLVASAFLSKLQETGALVLRFNPVMVYPWEGWRHNPLFRNHRKVLVCDDTVFIGSNNITENYAGMETGGTNRFSDACMMITGNCADDIDDILNETINTNSENIETSEKWEKDEAFEEFRNNPYNPLNPFRYRLFKPPAHRKNNNINNNINTTSSSSTGINNMNMNMNTDRSRTPSYHTTSAAAAAATIAAAPETTTEPDAINSTDTEVDADTTSKTTAAAAAAKAASKKKPISKISDSSGIATTPLGGHAQLFNTKRLRKRLRIPGIGHEIDSEMNEVPIASILSGYHEVPGFAEFIEGRAKLENSSKADPAHPMFLRRPKMEWEDSERGQGYHIDPFRNVFLQVLESNSRMQKFQIQEAFQHSLAASQKYAYFTTPYFLPPSRLGRSMIEAAQRGVDVRVLTAGRSDVLLWKLASRHIYPNYLKKGIRIWEYQYNLLHTKVSVLDGVYGTIGSFNLDIYSGKMNLELNVAYFNPYVAERMRIKFFEMIGETTKWTMKGETPYVREITVKDVERWGPISRLIYGAAYYIARVVKLLFIF